MGGQSSMHEKCNGQLHPTSACITKGEPHMCSRADNVQRRLSMLL